MSLPALFEGERRTHFVYLVVNGVLQAGVMIGSARLVQVGFDRFLMASGHPDPASFGLFVAGLLGLIAAGAGLRWRSHLDAESLGQSYVHALRMRLFRHLMRLGVDGVQRASPGALMLRFVGDLSALRNWVSLGLARLLVSGLAIVVSLAALLWIEPVIALAVGVSASVSLLLVMRLGPILRDRTWQARHERGRIASVINDRISKLAVIESFGQETREVRRIKKVSRKLRGTLVRRASAVGLLRAFSEISAGLAGACALAVGVVQVSMGQTTPGAVVAAMAVAGLLAPRINELGRVFEYHSGASVAKEKLLQLLQTRAPTKRRRTSESSAQAHGVRSPFAPLRIKNVSNFLFDDISVQIEPGARVAICGPNGSGKSTLIRLISGLSEADSGSVYLGDRRLKTIPWPELRRYFSLVSPEIPLLRGSLRFNLTYAVPRVAPAQLANVIRECGLDELVARLDHGLETRISDKGTGLSTGEKARISLARALLVEPRVLILDEAESNLDIAARRALLDVVRRFTGSVIFVSHDGFLLSEADLILNIEGRKIHICNSQMAPALRPVEAVIPTDQPQSVTTDAPASLVPVAARSHQVAHASEYRGETDE